MEPSNLPIHLQPDLLYLRHLVLIALCHMSNAVYLKRRRGFQGPRGGWVGEGRGRWGDGGGGGGGVAGAGMPEKLEKTSTSHLLLAHFGGLSTTDA